MNFPSPLRPSNHNQLAISVCSDQARLHQLAASIMTSNSIEQVATYQSFLRDYFTLAEILPNLCTSKEIYFVTSELLLRMLKKSDFKNLKLKLTETLVMSLNHCLSADQYQKAMVKFYNSIQNKYIEVISSNLDSLQKHEYKQAVEIITHTLSELLNICSQQEMPHKHFINKLFPSYYEASKMTNFTVLQHVINYQPFNCLNQKDAVFPQNVELYKVLLNVMTQVIEMKEIWEDEKYNQSQYHTNRRKFKNRFIQDWVEFAIKQAKLFINLYLSQEKLIVSHNILHDVVKLLHQVLLFSYDSPKSHHEHQRPRYVKSPQYLFPQGILKQLGEDHTFLQVLHQVHTKVILLNQAKNQQIGGMNGISGQNQGDEGLAEDKVIDVCEKILAIYGRMFFVTAQSEKNKQNQTLLMENITSSDEIPSYLVLHFTKVSILSQIIQNPLQYLCYPTQNKKKSKTNVKQRYNLQYAIVEITSQFIIYSRCIQEPNRLNLHSKSDQLKFQIRQKMKQFLVGVVHFAHEHCLQSECWKIMYGLDEDIEKEDIFTDLRHLQLFFPQKVFEMLYQCHQTIDFKFYNPVTQLHMIKFFYQRYFQITDQFLGKFQAQFSEKISRMITQDFNLEYSMMKEFFRAMPYVRIKEDKLIKYQVEYKMHDLSFVQEHYEPVRQEDGEKVLGYFEKFDEIITNICCTIQTKYQTGVNTNTHQNLSFFYYLISVLLQHYLKNSNFYTRASHSLVSAIKLLLKIAFQGSSANSAASVFAFYEQIVYILSEKSCNSRELAETVFLTEEQALNVNLGAMELGNIPDQRLIIELKNKTNSQRSLELVKKLMKSTCQRLITTDVKQLDAALIVLEKILKDFHQNPFVEQFEYLKEFVQNYMNLPQSLFIQKKHKQRKMKVIQLTAQFMQLKQNNFSQRQLCQFLLELNTTFISRFLQQKSLPTLLQYFSSIQQLLKTNHDKKVFILDLFLQTIQDFIRGINKDYRKHISINIEFYETTKSLLHTLLQVVELFGGQQWGSKFKQDEEEQRQKSVVLFQPDLENQREEEQENHKFNESDQWKENERDNDLALIVEEYFYTWVKELGREDFEVQNSSTWTRAQQQANDKQIVQIYAQFIHLTPNGKLPPLPKALVQKQRNIHLCAHLQKAAKVSQQIPPLQDMNIKETRTTKQMIKLYLMHVYRLSDNNFLALYPSIDYKFDYIKKWWAEVMVRGLKPQINIGYVYKKFIMLGRHAIGYEPNRQLAQMFFKIANYYKNDHEYIAKILQQPYPLRLVLTKHNGNHMMMTGNENVPQFTNNIASLNVHNQIAYEERKEYVMRILEFWTMNHN